MEVPLLFLIRSGSRAALCYKDTSSKAFFTMAALLMPLLENAFYWLFETDFTVNGNFLEIMTIVD
jgi:hypothetical protein